MRADPPIALWVVPVGDFGGVARHVLDVAEAGLPGYRLVVAAPEGELLVRLRDLGAATLVLDLDGSLPRTVRRLRRIIERLGPTVVHSHLAKADFLVALATVGLDVATVSTEHHIQPDQRVFHRSAARATGRRLAHHTRIRGFDQLIAVSESTRRDMLRHWRPTAPITVIHNGVDRQTPTDREPGLRVLSLTRLSPEKNLRTTLRAFAAVHAAHPGASLTVAGVGPELDELRSLTLDLGVGDYVDFPGFVDPDRAMREHDVVLQPSLADNFSYTLLDAVNAGLGVVASPLGGNAEMLPARCLVPADDESALADAVIEQGLTLEARPTMPESVPTVSLMCRRITEVYADAAPQAAATTPPTDPVADTSPQISVVTAYYRNGATLPAQLDALVAQRDAPPFEVVIADNEGSARLAQLVADYADRLDIRLVPANTKQGQCHARNVGVQAARSPFIAMSDADDVVGPRWVAAMYRMLQAGDVLAAGPRRLDVINPEVAVQAKARLDGLSEVPRPYLQGPFGYLGYEQFVHGSNLGVRRSTYLDLGGMNEDMLGGSEDVDFSWRAIESGRQIEVCDEALVDYRLRDELKAVRAQAYRYQRAQLGLWARSRRMGRPVRGMSLRWALQQNARTPMDLLRSSRADAVTRYCAAARSGSVFGNLIGQLAVRGPWRA